ncbi:MAG TPA: helix-turn-helix transcriptional regulator [Gemmatimonadales bacterium]
MVAGRELLILAAIDRLVGTDRPAYGVTIRDELAKRLGRAPSLGAIYAGLGRLADQGLIALSLSEPTPVQGGRARRLARLTPAGRAALRRATVGLARLFDGLPVLAGS